MLFSALRAEDRPTGIVAFCDFDAIRILRIAATAGVRVPEDLSVVGFDDLWPAGQPEYNLTTIAQPRSLIGRRSMETLLEKIKGGKAEGLMLEPELVVRGSTAPPPTPTKRVRRRYAL